MFTIPSQLRNTGVPILHQKSHKKQPIIKDHNRVRVVQRRLRHPVPEQVRPARGEDHSLAPRRPLPRLQGPQEGRRGRQRVRAEDVRRRERQEEHLPLHHLRHGCGLARNTKAIFHLNLGEIDGAVQWVSVIVTLLGRFYTTILGQTNPNLLQVLGLGPLFCLLVYGILLSLPNSAWAGGNLTEGA